MKTVIFIEVVIIIIEQTTYDSYDKVRDTSKGTVTCRCVNQVKNVQLTHHRCLLLETVGSIPSGTLNSVRNVILGKVSKTFYMLPGSGRTKLA